MATNRTNELTDVDVASYETHAFWMAKQSRNYSATLPVRDVGTSGHGRQKKCRDKGSCDFEGKHIGNEGVHTDEVE